MYVSDYIDFLVNGEVQKLAVSDVGDMDPNAAVAPSAAQVVNQDKFVYFKYQNNSFTVIKNRMEHNRIWYNKL